MGKDMFYLLPEVIEPENSLYVCLRIPDDPGHRQAFAGALGQLTRWWSWERDDLKRGKDAAAVWFEIWQDAMLQLDQRLDSCGGGDMYCCDETNALLTQLLACCRNNGKAARIEINNYRTEIYNTYSSDPTSIDDHTPQTTYDTNTGDTTEQAAARLAALCLAIEMYTAEVWRQAKDRKEIASGLVIAGTWLLTGGLAGVVLVIGEALVAALILSIFDDTDAMQAIRCAMYDNLIGESVDFASWKAAILNLGAGGTDAEQQLGHLIQVSGYDETNWLMFLQALGQSLDIAMAGGASIEPCTCGPQTWSHVLDFRTGALGWTFAMGDNSPNGQQDSTYGLRSSWTLDNQYGWAQRFYAQRDFSPAFTMTSLSIEILIDVPVNVGVFQMIVNGVSKHDALAAGTTTWIWSTPGAISSIYFSFFPLPSVAGQYDYAGVVRMTVAGTGPDPFA